jgi:hypothetical protein
MICALQYIIYILLTSDAVIKEMQWMQSLEGSYLNIDCWREVDLFGGRVLDSQKNYFLLSREHFYSLFPLPFERLLQDVILFVKEPKYRNGYCSLNVTTNLDLLGVLFAKAMYAYPPLGKSFQEDHMRSLL